MNSWRAPAADLHRQLAMVRVGVLALAAALILYAAGPCSSRPAASRGGVARRSRGLHALAPRAREAGCAGDAPLAWPCPGALENKFPAAPSAARRVMLVTAHPDDESMASGLVSVLQRSNTLVRIVVLTNGDKGSGNLSRSVTPAKVAKARAIEMQNAAAELNATAVILGYEDGRLANT